MTLATAGPTFVDVRSPAEIAILILGVLTALLVGHLWGRGRRRVVVEELDRVQSKLDRAEAQIGEQNRRIAKMRGERDTVANLALSLPEVVRDLNRDDLHPRDVPKLIYMLANSIFQPEQFLLYWLARSDDGRKVLKLIFHRGLDGVPSSLDSVRLSEGKIGWAARHELDMLPEDWNKVACAERAQIPDNHPSLRADIVGPLFQRGKDKAQLLGVLCIGAPRARPRDEKLMFQMVTNFGSMAIVNARMRDTLRRQAEIDGLTKLYNKRSFLGKHAPQMLVECEKRARPFSLFIFDIDHFKKYNDGNGHPAGDRLLKRMGEIIGQHVESGQMACRYGGEEFVIVMPNKDKEAALAQAEKLRLFIENEPFEFREKQPLGYVSISGGIASLPQDGAEIGVLIQRADEALYEGKKAGRNRITRYRSQQIGESVEEILSSTGASSSADPRAGTAVR